MEAGSPSLTSVQQDIDEFFDQVFYEHSDLYVWEEYLYDTKRGCTASSSKQTVMDQIPSKDANPIKVKEEIMSAGIGNISFENGGEKIKMSAISSFVDDCLKSTGTNNYQICNTISNNEINNSNFNNLNDSNITNNDNYNYYFNCVDNNNNNNNNNEIDSSNGWFTTNNNKGKTNSAGTNAKKNDTNRKKSHKMKSPSYEKEKIQREIKKIPSFDIKKTEPYKWMVEVNMQPLTHRQFGKLYQMFKMLLPANMRPTRSTSRNQQIRMKWFCEIWKDMYYQKLVKSIIISSCICSLD